MKRKMSFLSCYHLIPRQWHDQPRLSSAFPGIHFGWILNNWCFEYLISFVSNGFNLTNILFSCFNVIIFYYMSK